MTQNEAIIELEILLKTWTQTTLGRRSFLMALPLVLGSCATGDKTRYREGDNSGQETSLSVDDEIRMTNQALPEMRKDYPALKDPEVQGYVSGIGRKLVSANSLEGNPYRYTFSVVDVKQVNAFALPAGTIFVTAPLITMADSEAELAGVIGHEIGHVKARHAAERIDKAEQEKGKGWLYALGGGLLGGAAGFGIGKMVCPPEDSGCVQKAMQLGAVAGVGGGLLVQKYKFMANSREDEMEADRIGFRTATKAGYHPDQVGSFYTKLLKMESSRGSGGGNALMSAVADAMSTHPPSRERVQQMQEMVRSSNRSGIDSTKSFDRIKAKLISEGKKA